MPRGGRVGRRAGGKVKMLWSRWSRVKRTRSSTRTSDRDRVLVGFPSTLSIANPACAAAAAAAAAALNSAGALGPRPY